MANLTALPSLNIPPMKKLPLFLLSVSSLLVFAGCAATSSSSTADSSPFPEISPEGLTRVKGSKADLVYVLPGADLSAYTKVALTEPEIAFRQNWLSDTNARRNLMDRLSNADMIKMIKRGKELLREEFTKELAKGGYTVVTEAGPDVLVVKTAVLDVDVFAPDPNNLAGAWSKTYSPQGAGEATMVVELLDSVSGQLLTQAYDRKSGRDSFATMGMSRSQSTNVMDASNVLNYWAHLLVKGLDRAKASKLAAAAKP
jgi:hypothetical protein